VILDRILQQCAREFPEISVHVNISYLAEKFLEHFFSTKHNLIPSFIYEKQKLGPARSLTEFLKLGHRKTLVIHGDLVVENYEFSCLAHKIRSAENQIIVCHQRPYSSARSRVNLKNGRVTAIDEFNPKSTNNESENLILVCSGIYTIFAGSLDGYHPELGESLAPNLLNYSISNQETQIYGWRGWRFAIDSPQAYLMAKAKILESD
jgi:NDP-sugar pyrophosphorylase family protein